MSELHEANRRDAYLAAALNRLALLSRDDRRLELLPTDGLVQGKNNRVVCARYAGRPVVAKFYAGGFQSSVPARLRLQRELTFLHHAQGTGVVPAVVAAFDDVLLLEDLPGEPLDAWLRNRSLQAVPDATAQAIGEAHRRLLALSLTTDECATIERDCFEGETLEQRLDRLLAAARPMAHLAPRTLSAIESVLPELLATPRLLYKYDNNLGNVLVDQDGGFVGLIDFEQCYLGTRWLYLGAVYDCAHALPWDRQAAPVVYQQVPWPALARGLDVGVTPPLVIIAAMLNHWQRVTGLHADGKDAAWWTSRFVARFQAYQQALESTR